MAANAVDVVLEKQRYATSNADTSSGRSGSPKPCTLRRGWSVFFHTHKGIENKTLVRSDV